MYTITLTDEQKKALQAKGLLKDMKGNTIDRLPPRFSCRPQFRK